MAVASTLERIPLSAIRHVYHNQVAYSGDFAPEIQKFYKAQGAYGLAPYLNLNGELTSPENATATFSFLATIAETDPAALDLLRHALRVNARNNLLDARTLEEGMSDYREFLGTTTIKDIHASCALPQATAAISGGKTSAPALTNPPTNEITTPAICLADTALGHQDDKTDREFEIGYRAAYCDALRVLVTTCLRLGLQNEVEQAIATAQRLEKPAFTAIAELCKKEGNLSNAPGATDDHAWQFLRNRLAGVAVDVEAMVVAG